MYQGDTAQLLPDLEIQLDVEPPRIPGGQAVAHDHELIWSTVIDWVGTHKKLIRKVTGGLHPYFPGNSRDVWSLAHLVAFEALKHCALRGQIDRFLPIFCKKFRNALINQCKQVPIAQEVDVEDLPDPNQSPYFPAPWPQNLCPGMKAAALARMLPRQAKVWTHFLVEWDASLSCEQNAQPFARAAYYDLLNRGIDRVARKVREEQT
jgi:hypothetical protein